MKQRSGPSNRTPSRGLWLRRSLPALLLAAAASAAPAHAATLAVSLESSPPSPKPLGTMIRWTAVADTASADVWFELLHAPCWTGSDADIDADSGEVSGSIDCFNKDFNGDTSRTILSIKAFQPWKYGFVFLYYDVTGPFNKAGIAEITANEKGGFFGGTTVAISPKRNAFAPRRRRTKRRGARS